MKVQRLPKSYFDRFAEKPVTIKPFDPHSKELAMNYLAMLNETLASHEVEAKLHGSVELEVAGKGEWEYAIYLDDERNRQLLDWVEQHDIPLDHFHTSGHADADTLRSFREAFADARVVPIHTPFPGSYAQLFENV